MKWPKCPWSNWVEPDQRLAQVVVNSTEPNPLSFSLSRSRARRGSKSPPPSPADSGVVRRPPPPCCGAVDAPRRPHHSYPGDAGFLARCARAGPNLRLGFERRCGSAMPARLCCAAELPRPGAGWCPLCRRGDGGAPASTLLQLQWTHGHCFAAMATAMPGISPLFSSISSPSGHQAMLCNA